MEDNRNNAHISINLESATGKAVFAAIAAVLAGGAIETPSKAQAVKAAPAPKAAASATTATEEVAEDATQTSGKSTPEPKAASKPAAPKAAAPAPKAAAPKPAAKPAEVAFEDLDADAQLEALKAHVTKHTKKGKSADIKALLSNFGSDRVSTLEAEHYLDFNDVLNRYSAGESVEDIFPSVD